MSGSAEIVAVIPARGGSKGIPRKNLREVGGVPLIVRAIRSARASDSVDRVVVTTDDAEIRAVALAAGADVVDRPETIAGDEASSEAALLHALDALDDRGVSTRILVFIQATSPFIDTDALEGAIARVDGGEADVVFAAVETHAFLWRLGDEGATGINHDHSFRPRRQDREPQWQETGAFYVMRAAGFRERGYRFFGSVGVAAVDERYAMEIDTPEQLAAASALASVIDPAQGGVRSIDVDAVVTDFDGVHTDDRVLVGEDGSEFVTANRSDGMGVRLLREAGVTVLILSTEVNPVVAARGRKLRVEVLQGLDDKATALTEWAAANAIPLDRVAYVGNDVNDLGCLAIVGWPVAVADAHPLVISAARVILTRRGGDGAVRELAELALPNREGTA
ncbi:N-acylneuraminate cytidylyltransferase [Conyzicola lurida]|uniref:N-acylneuraminate cytidylyltransferase n=1 Tax=Conyzicola lurida TaxID=1172621 RepID=A0A841AM09_9MICO|nr:N-acylneuraminate cytidylyltransferase [Conyzicola lurida]